MKWDSDSAHSAAYDARITAEVFCAIVNQFRGIYEQSRRDRGA
jgi:ribonuclease T